MECVYDLDQYLGLQWDIIDPLTRTLDWNGMCLRPRPVPWDWNEMMSWKTPPTDLYPGLNVEMCMGMGIPWEWDSHGNPMGMGT